MEAGPKGGHKLAKAARRQARKIYTKEMKDQAGQMGRMFANRLKPNPWWVPRWLWKKGIRIFLKID